MPNLLEQREIRRAVGIERRLVEGEAETVSERARLIELSFLVGQRKNRPPGQTAIRRLRLAADDVINPELTREWERCEREAARDDRDDATSVLMLLHRDAPA